MQQLFLEETKPLSEFPKSASSFLATVQEEPKAVVYTDGPADHGAVILALASYQEMKDELELLRDIHRAAREIDAGKALPHDQALEKVLSGLG